MLTDIGEHLDTGKRQKETFESVFEEAGGMIHANGLIELPRNTKQIHHVKQSHTKNKLSISTCAPAFRCVCASDLQLMEMETFLTNPSECTIMGLDPNFNLGEFVVMSIVYKNLKLIYGRTGKCPTFLGPVLV